MSYYADKEHRFMEHYRLTKPFTDLINNSLPPTTPEEKVAAFYETYPWFKASIWYQGLH